MQSCWLHKENRPNCILFLAGWGMDPEPFRSIPVRGHDLMIAYDYRQVEPSGIMEDTARYGTLHLIAWSMGVWVAGRFFDDFRDRFASATAVNGTLQPIDNQLGIPPKVFDRMLQGFSPDVLAQFYRDMFDHPGQAERFLQSRPDRPWESIREELEALRSLYREFGPGTDIFSRRIVGSRDRIFAARAQQRSWGDEPCERIKIPHFPFYNWPSWDLVTAGEQQDACN